MALADRLGLSGSVAVSAAGIYTFYLYYGILQERLYRPDADGKSMDLTLFLLAAQCLASAVLGAAAVAASGSGGGTVKPAHDAAASSPFGAHSGNAWLAAISLAYLGAMGCSNQSLHYVSYPFQALAKSCKMVPVMLADVVIGGKRYPLAKLGVVLVVTAGVVLFRLAGTERSSLGGHSALGLALIGASLALDGVTAAHQRLFSEEYRPSGVFMMRQMNLWSLAFLAPLLALSGEASEAAAYLSARPERLLDVALFAGCSSLGQLFVFFCVVGPGPLVCTTITTTRKFFTVLLSVLWYPDNQLSPAQWAAVALVFAGLGVDIERGRRAERRARGFQRVASSPAAAP